MSFEKGVLNLKVEKLFNEKHFSICDLKEIGELIGVNVEQNPNYKNLRALHCINYSDMPAEVLNELQSKVIECLSCRRFNPALVTSIISSEGNDFEFTEDRYLDSVKLIK